MIVYKFGGTSLADAERMRLAATLVRECAGPRVVVVSALAGVTDQLVELAARAGKGIGWEAEAARRTEALWVRHEEVAAGITGDAAGRAALMEKLDAAFSRLQGALEGVAEEGEAADRSGQVDRVIAIGEDLSGELMAVALVQEGLAAEVVDARSVVRTDERFGGAVPKDEETARLIREVLTPLLEQGRVPVLQGFVGATEDGITTTLGRGGSDFTAAIIGAALGATEVGIWTDVDGVLSAEPGHVSAARVLDELGYEEAVELAYFGAKVIHPAAAKHAAAGDVSLRVRNAQRPEAAGTLIRHDVRRAVGVAAVAYKPSVTLVKVRSRPMFMAYGFLARVFDVLARHRLPVDLVATSHTSTAFTLDRGEGLGAAEGELSEFAEVEVLPELATVSVVGHGLLRRPGITAGVFSALGQTPVQLISQASDVCLSFLVAQGDAAAVVRRLHAELIEAVSEDER
ncbi:MAG: aspartate kinase [Gemmatimonadota bacterium]|nr:MAG: aspartate kinase [Gemmatimonadota bacterium]